MNGIAQFSESDAKSLKRKRAARKMRTYLYSALRMFFLLSIGYLILYPLLYMIITSVSSGNAYNNSIRVWLPSELNIKENFVRALNVLDYGTAFLSTFKNQLISAALEVGSCAFAAYGFARFNFKGKKILRKFCKTWS